MRDFDDFLNRMLCCGGDGGDGGGGGGSDSNYTGPAEGEAEANDAFGAGSGPGPGPGTGESNGAPGTAGSGDYNEAMMGGPAGPGKGGAWTSSGEGLGTFGDVWRGEMGLGQWALGRAAEAMNYDPGAALANLGFNLAFPGLGMVNSTLGLVGAPTVGSVMSNAYAMTGPNNPTTQNISQPDPTSPTRGEEPTLMAALEQDPLYDVPQSVPRDEENFSGYQSPSLISDGIGLLSGLGGTSTPAPTPYRFVRYRG
jgi:hypothetical protein